MPGMEAQNISSECGWSSPANGTEPLDSTSDLFQSLLPGQTVPALICIFVLLTLFSFVVNLLTLSSIGRSDDLSWQPRFTFCRNLILSDLIQTAIFGPAVIHSLVHRRTMTLGCCLATITCMALERYLYVCYAINYLAILTQRRLRLVLTLIWVYSVTMVAIVTGLLFVKGDGEKDDTTIPGFLASALVRKIFGPFTVLLCLLVHAFSYFRMYQDARNAVVPFNAVNVTARNTVMFYCGMLFLQLLPLLFKVTSDAVWDFRSVTEPSSQSPGGCRLIPTQSGTAAALHVSLLIMLMVPPCVNPLVYGIRNVEMRRALIKLFSWRPEHRGAQVQRADRVAGEILLHRQAQAG
ncbi:olfactory receptor 2G3 [Xenentodon cancila]